MRIGTIRQPAPRSARTLLGDLNAYVPRAHVIRDVAGVESIHAFEGTETIQTLVVGADITGTGACS